VLEKVLFVKGGKVFKNVTDPLQVPLTAVSAARG
jgi:hypothetical protein